MDEMGNRSEDIHRETHFGKDGSGWDQGGITKTSDPLIQMMVNESRPIEHE